MTQHRMHVVDVIEEKAHTDGQYAIAYALLQIAEKIETVNGHDLMIDLVSAGLEHIASAIDLLANRD